MCAQFVGDIELGAVYGKSELVQDNPNPVKRFHSNCCLAVINLEWASVVEDEQEGAKPGGGRAVAYTGFCARFGPQMRAEGPPDPHTYSKREKVKVQQIETV